MAGPNATTGASVDYVVVFDQDVIGVDASDFAVVTTGTVQLSQPLVVAGSGTTYQVSTTGVTGEGTLRIDLVDDDSIQSVADGEPLGGLGVGNGDFSGSAVTVEQTQPTASFTATPPAVTNSTTATFELTGSDGGGSGFDRFETSLDGAPFAPIASNPFTLTVGGGSRTLRARAVDNAGNVGAEVSHTWMVDTRFPTVTITGGPSSLINVRTATVTFTSVDNLSNGVASGVDRVEASFNGASYVTATSPMTFNNLADGDYVLTLRAIDVAGNVSTLKTRSWTVDATAPTVSITKDQTSLTTPTPINYTFTFSEAITGFSSSDVAVTNGSKGAFTAVSATTYTLVVTPTASGSVTASIALNAGRDAANNPTPVASASVTYAPPVTVTITPNGTYSNASEITFTMTFSEAVTWPSTVSIVGATPYMGSQLNSKTYVSTFVATTDGPVTISLPVGSSKSTATNVLSAAASATVISDRTAPTPTITPNNSATNSSSLLFNFAFNEAAVTGFDATDVTVTNGTAGAFTVIDNLHYTLAVTPTADGNVTVNVAAGRVTDAAGNVNSAKSATVLVDRQAPTLVMTNPPASKSGTVDFTLTFGETVTSLDNSKIVITNSNTWTITPGAAATGTTYVVSVTPTTAGPVTVSLASGAGRDAAGNNSPAASATSYRDSVLPAVASINRSAGPSSTSASSVSFDVVFTQNVSGVDAGDFVAACTGTAAAAGPIVVTQTTPSTYVVTVNGLTGGGAVGLNFVNDRTVVNSNGSIVVGDVSYAAGQTLATAAAGVTATGDLNNDGKLDLVIGFSSGTPRIAVYKGNGNGTFQTPVTYSPPNVITDLVLADYTGDGKLDLVTTNTTASFSLYPGNGDGTFGTRVNVTNSLVPVTLAAGDFDKDGKADVFASTASNVAISKGLGAGAFSANVTFDASGAVTRMKVANVTPGADTLLDVVYTDTAHDRIGVLLGNGGSGTFKPLATFATGDQPGALALGNLDGDVYPDLVVANGAAGVDVFLHIGDTSSQTPTSFATGVVFNSMFVADVNGDGNGDLVAGSSSDGLIRVFAGNGNGTFQAPKTYSTGTTPLVGAAGDFDRDGDLDFVASTSTSLRVMLDDSGAAFVGQTYDVDRTPPTVSIANSAAYATAAPTFSFSAVDPILGGVASGLNHLEVSLDGAAFATATSPVSVAGLAEGAHVFQVRGYDNLGNVATTSYSFTVDAAPPTMTTVVPAVVPTAFTLPLTATDPGSNAVSSGIQRFEYRLDAAATFTSTTSSSVSFSNFTAANHTLELRAVDAAGNVGPSLFATFLADGVKPFLNSFVRDDDRYSSGGTLGFTITFSEPVTGVDAADFVFKPNGAVTYSSLTVTPVSGSVYSITVTNVAGNGILGVNLIDNGTIFDLYGNALAARTGTLTFGAPQTFKIGRTNPSSHDFAKNVAVGDFNEDGFLDLVGGTTGPSIALRLGNGNGTFAPQQTFAASSYSASAPIAVADLDHDGHLDLVVPTEESTDVFLGNGNGTFKPKRTEPSYNGILVDLDSDGNVDLIGSRGDISVFDPRLNVTAGIVIQRGNGDGTFQPARYLTNEVAINVLSFGDLNGDGLLDIMSGGYQHLGDGAGGLAKAVPIPWAVTDANGDGTLDLVAGTGLYASVRADLQAQWGVSVLDRTYYVDLNGDDALDKVEFGYNWSGPSISVGNGDGTFQPGQGFNMGMAGIGGLTLGDVNGDGKLDLVAHQLYETDVNNTVNVSVRLAGGSGVSSFAGPSYVIDSVAPTVSFVVTPPAISAATAKFTFAATETAGLKSGAGFFEYRIDGGSLVRTDATAVVSGLPAGSHVVEVRAFDKAGNASPFISHSWTVDATAPTVAITSASVGGLNKAMFVLAGDDSSGSGVSSGIARFEYRLDGAPFRTGLNPLRLTALSGGSHVLHVRAVDVAGNVGPATQYAWTVPANLASGAVTFSAPQPLSLGTGQGLGYLETADLDNDGNADLVATSGASVTIMLGNGDGTFQQRRYATGEAPGAIAVRDFNNDGVLDFLTLESARLTTYLGNGDGTFRWHSIAVASYPYRFAVGDIDGDGILDCVTQSSHSYAFLAGNGDGTFQPRRALPLLELNDHLPGFVNLADVDLDGDLDAIVGANGTDFDVHLQLGNGNGSFGYPIIYPGDTFGVNLGAGLVVDVNADGKPDIAGEGGIYVGNADGTFVPVRTPGVSIFFDLSSNSPTYGDVNGDGVLDFVCNSGEGGISVFLGNGDATFQPIQGFGVTASTSDVALADFDGDGRLDAASATSAGTVDLLLTGSEAAAVAPATVDPHPGIPAPVVTKVAPFVGPTTGATVVITGQNFYAVKEVRFGDRYAGFKVNSATQITATSPNDDFTPIVPGIHEVVVVTDGGSSSSASTDNDYTYIDPRVLSVVVNGGTIAARDRFGEPLDLANQQSLITQIEVKFNEPVQVSAGAFSLTPVPIHWSSVGAPASSLPVQVNWAPVAGTGNSSIGYSQYVLTFAGAGVNLFDNTTDVGSGPGLGTAFSTLKDGLYRFSINSQFLVPYGVASPNGEKLAYPNLNHTELVWSLYGVVDPGAIQIQGELGGWPQDYFRVDGLALNDIYSAFGSRSIDPNYRAAYDCNLDGFVDGIDLSRLYQNFGTIWCTE